MISVTGLTKVFDGYKALENVTCQIPEGCIYGMVGSNGAGKSTLIDGLTFDYNLYKFPMGAVCKYFEIQPTWEMQIAKDISIFHSLSNPTP